MILNFILLLVLCSIIVFYYKNKKQKILDKYGVPINLLFLSTYNLSFRISAINPTFIAIYDNKLIIIIGNEEILINKENFISFSEPTFIKPCTIKFKVNSIYKSREIHFSIISKKQISIIKNTLSKF